MNIKEKAFECGVYLRRLDADPFRKRILSGTAGRTINGISKKEYAIFMRYAPKKMTAYEKRCLFIVAGLFSRYGNSNAQDSIFARASVAMNQRYKETIKKVGRSVLLLDPQRGEVFERNLKRFVELITTSAGAIDYESFYVDLLLWNKENKAPQKRLASILYLEEVKVCS